MFNSLMRFLTSKEDPRAKALRDNFVMVLIPMLNPDGVIHGNYRTGLCGSDLNRKWKAPRRLLQSTVYYTKKLIQDFQATHNLQLFCDFHGHSRK